MPPKHRGGKGNPDGKKPKEPQTRPSTAHAQSAVPGPAPKKREVKWWPVFKRIGLFLAILAVPAFLNYVAVNQEARVLMPKGTNCSLIVENITVSWSDT